MSHKRVKLVLSGSGTRYPVFVGAYRRLVECGYSVSAVCGTSGGAIVAAAIAAGLGPDALEKLVLSVLPRNHLDVRWWPSWSADKGVDTGNKLLAAFRKHLPAKWENCKIPLRIVTFDLNAGQHVVHAPGGLSDDVPLLVRASMSLPVLFDPVKIAGRLHVDGGIGANFPLDVFGNGSDVLGLRFAPSATHLRPRTLRTKLDVAGAVLDGLIASADREHIEDAQWAQTVQLHTTDSGMNFAAGPHEVEAMMAEGYASLETWRRTQI